jgi:hypothetical protein
MENMNTNRPDQHAAASRTGATPGEATDSTVSLDRGTAPAGFQQTERYVQKKFPAFRGASPTEAADDQGCALVSLNYIMISEGFEAFSNDEVQRAHQAALQAQLGNQTAIDKYESTWTLKTVSKYIGNPDDGGAMSQPHVFQLFCQRFGRGNFTFKRCDKKVLSAAPNTAGASKYYLVTGVLERALTEKGGVPLLYGTKREQKDTHAQNLKFAHTICVVPGSYFICKNKRALLDGKLSYTRLDIDFLKLKADGDSKRGGYMRHIYRAFEVVLFRPVVERPLKKARVES